MVARASRGDARQIHRYLPRSIDPATRDWLRAALVGGTAAETRFTLAGNLAEFPFPNGKGGKLLLDTKAKGVTLAYADGWPPIDAIDAECADRGNAPDRRRCAGPCARRRYRQDARRDSRPRAGSPAAADRRRSRGTACGIPPLRQRKSGCGANGNDHEFRRSIGRRTPGVEDRAAARAARRHKVRGRVHAVRRAVADRRRAGSGQGQWQALVQRTRRSRTRRRRGDPGRTREARVRRRRRTDARDRYRNAGSRRAAARVRQRLCSIGFRAASTGRST